MKLIIETEDPDEINMLVNVCAYVEAVDEIRRYLREQLKHADLSEEDYEVFEKIRDKVIDITSELGI